MRHHLCRQDDPREATRQLVKRYVEAVDALKCESKKIYELLPIETEKRIISHSGRYKGEPFHGSWELRNVVRLWFKEFLFKYAQNTDIEIVEWITEKFYNERGEMRLDAMELGKSVHISRELYPHWTGEEYNNKKTDTLEGLFE